MRRRRQPHRVARRWASAALALALAACVAPGRPSAPPPSSEPFAPGTPSGAPVAPAPLAEDPPRPRTRFAGRVRAPLPAAIRAELRAGGTWRPGCPVALADLALLRFNHVGLDGRIHRGRLVVHRSVAAQVLGAFRTLFEAGFPLERVDLARRFRPNADPDTRRNATAGFNCRPVLTPDGPGTTLSQHAYGLAVDVNPLLNPYVAADGSVRNRYARPYADRSRLRPGMIREGDVVVRAFAAIGWSWGGRWSGAKDYMHFSLTGR